MARGDGGSDRLLSGAGCWKVIWQAAVLLRGGGRDPGFDADAAGLGTTGLMRGAAQGGQCPARGVKGVVALDLMEAGTAATQNR